MVVPHPSLTLVLHVDQKLATEQTRQEVNRCYSYVASTVLRPHETPEGEQPYNTVDFLVKFGGRRYLYSADEGADELWESAVEDWLYNKFYTVGNNMKIYNRRQREIGNDELYFDFMDVDFESKRLIVRLRLDSNSDIVPDTNKTIGALRRAINDGTLGTGVVQVQMPSETSYHTQYAAGMQAKAEREAQEAAQAISEAEEQAAQAAQAVEQAAADFMESPDLVDTAQEDEAKALQEELERAYSLPEADFVIDYSIWQVLYDDGSMRVFDSSTGSFVEEDPISDNSANVQNQTLAPEQDNEKALLSTEGRE